MNGFANFKVLLDDPADVPGLGFHDYSSALAEMIISSRAEFAVGIFGSWGSGKTTLMRAIQRHLADDPNVVTVWFTAWRYEKEEHLIVPLLDVLREALYRRAKEEAAAQPPTQRAAAAIARAGRAFLAGLTVSAGVPGLEARLEPDKVITALRQENDKGDESLSFYHAGFVMLRDAILEFSAGGTRRVVVFVDDLDRCLPSNALDVLESMKLFFDVEGCVFVVGLDQAIAERAVALKYMTPDGAMAQSPVSGTDYVKKIFQVPFTLPRISTSLLQEYLTTVATNAELSEAQRADFNGNVRRHMQFLPGEDSVNPREVKRLVNTYTLQLKMLGKRLGGRLDPNIVLALQCMSFRPDWRDLYDHLAADPQLFQSALRAAVEQREPPDAVWLSGVKVALPAQFLQYVTSDARPLLDDPELQSYVSVAESTRSSDPSILEAQMMINRLRQVAESFSEGLLSVPDAAKRLQGDIRRLADVTARRTPSVPLERPLRQLEILARELTAAEPTPGDQRQFAQDWTGRTTPLLDALDVQLQQMRRQANVGAHA